MHVALLTFSEGFSWSRKDGELIWYHDKGDCISGPVLSQMNALAFVCLGVKSCSSLLCQSCKLIPVTAVVTLPSVLGFGSTEMFFRSNDSCTHCSSDFQKLYRENIIRTVEEAVCVPVLLSAGAGRSELQMSGAWGSLFSVCWLFFLQLLQDLLLWSVAWDNCIWKYCMLVCSSGIS